LLAAWSFLGGNVGLANAQKMYWTDSNTKKVQRANLDGTDVETLISVGLVQPQAIALDVAGGKMYWADAGADKIQRANLDGSGIENLVTTGIGNPFGIALDLSAGKIYWTDVVSPSKIMRSNLNGSSVETLLTTGNQSLGDIALDVGAGKMYWADFGTTDVIRRANLNGSSVETLVTGLSFPFSITLDVTGGKMYWTDTGADRIQRANLGGSGVETLVTGANAVGIALDVAGGKMYWTDRDLDVIRRADLDGSDEENLVTSGLSWPRGIALDLSVALPEQPINPNPMDGATSVPIETDLMWSDGGGAVTYDVYFGTNPAPGPAEFQGNQVEMTFDPGILTPSTTFHWRIDSVNDAGTTTGNVWQFATVSEPPYVSDVSASQRTDGSKFVDVYYNLADADDDVCTVTVEASDDNGVTWTVPGTALDGSVGPGIMPGPNKHITWECARDLPGAFGSQYRVRICADDGGQSGCGDSPAFTIDNRQGTDLDLFVQSIEMSQAIQDGTVPMIADRPIFLRITVDWTGSQAQVTGVNARLIVTAEGTPIPGSPFSSLNGPITAPLTPDLNNENDTVNFGFVVPQSDDVDLTVELNPAGPGRIPETDYANNTDTLENQAFECRRIPSIAYVPIDYRPTAGGPEPNLPDPAMIAPGSGDAFVEGVLPTPGLQYYEVPPVIWPHDINDFGQPQLYLIGLEVYRYTLSPRPDFLYAWVPGNPHYTYGGLSAKGGRVAWGNTSQLFYRRTFAHELGHCFGLCHPTGGICFGWHERGDEQIGAYGVDVEDRLGFGVLRIPRCSVLWSLGWQRTKHGWTRLHTSAFSAPIPSLAEVGANTTPAAMAR
jgi:hypothetical protein